MRLINIAIENVRGIKHLELEPDAENFIIWGPNGSGKSAVVDSIDFLLTGRMSRLMGEGTAGITLKRHGPHVDTALGEAWVRGIVLLPDKSQVEITRRLDSPETLRMDPSSEWVKTRLAQLTNGQHVLTRREVLRFVTSDAGTRAEKMRALLHLVDLESTRKALVSTKTRSERALQASDEACKQAVARFAPIIGLDNPSPQTVLSFVNKQRLRLGGDEISQLPLDGLKRDLQAPAQIAGGSAAIAPTELDELRTALRRVTEPDDKALAEFMDRLGEIGALARRLKADSVLMKEYRRREMLRLGLELLDSEGHCPLCEAEWPPGALRTRLEEGLAQSTAAHQVVTKLEILREPTLANVRTLTALLGHLKSLWLRAKGKPEAIRWLDEWTEELNLDLKALSSDPSDLARELEHLDIPGHMTSTEKLARSDMLFTELKSRSQQPRPEQLAWDLLTRLEEVLAIVQNSDQLVARRRTTAIRAHKLHKAFCVGQEQVLQELYGAIETRFTGLYRSLHGPDEDEFNARLIPKDTGLNFEVGFYGRGVHPPHALHSEGHQDSMGVCLFLTLCERLAGTEVEVVLLDDVVMSVDSEHRRALAALLAREFPDRQFLITTHDRTWANELKAEGVVLHRNLVQFYGWNLDAGPNLLRGSDAWAHIESNLEKDDVPSAAAALRRGAEEHCQQVCERLRAPVRFTTTARWDLGDLAPAAASKFRTLLKGAKKAANSWGQDEVVASLTETESILVQAVQRLQMEQWAVNENVHYNSWASFSTADFKPVVEAMKDFFDVFRCSHCHAMLTVAMEGAGETALKCKCGTVNWNLLDKR